MGGKFVEENTDPKENQVLRDEPGRGSLRGKAGRTWFRAMLVGALAATGMSLAIAAHSEQAGCLQFSFLSVADSPVDTKNLVQTDGPDHLHHGLLAEAHHQAARLQAIERFHEGRLPHRVVYETDTFFPPVISFTRAMKSSGD